MVLQAAMKLHIFVMLAVAGICHAAPFVRSGTNGQQLVRRDSGFDYQNDKVRGVNLGGWFVLEPFINPSMFAVFADGDDESNVPVDEYHYCQKLGRDNCQLTMNDHWASWITELDFEAIASFGMNMVRIPIGYWAFERLDSDPYVLGQQKYLDKALKWAGNHGLKVWIDLHGAPGSQNGFDNSGLRDSIDFQKGDNTKVTLSVLQKILLKYGGSDYEDVIIGIELLNEPLGPVLDMDKLKDFYTEGYDNLRDTGSVQNVVIHDAFQDPGYWNDFMNPDNYWNVVVDHHHYQVFSAGELQRDIDTHIKTACDLGTKHSQESHWNVIGEWSAALTDCTKWLNGVRRGARYSGNFDDSPYIGDCSQLNDYDSWPQDHKKNVRKYVEAQLDAYEHAGGWIYWTWKTEDAVEWDLTRLASAGLFPNPVTDRTYKNQCGYDN